MRRTSQNMIELMTFSFTSILHLGLLAPKPRGPWAHATGGAWPALSLTPQRSSHGRPARHSRGSRHRQDWVHAFAVTNYSSSIP